MATEYIKTVDALNGIYDCPTKIDEDGYIWVRTIDAVHKIDEIPTADVQPVVHGEWKPGKEISRTMLIDKTLAIEYDSFYCSSCGRRYKEYVLVYNFCPNCGARMTFKYES